MSTDFPTDPWDSDEYDALVAAALRACPEPVERAPNQREFTLNSAYAWSLFRPEPSMLPQIPLLRHNPVERDKGASGVNKGPETPGKIGRSPLCRPLLS